MFDIASSIVTYRNDFKTLQNTICSFLNTELNVKLYIVDNSPTDEIRRICNDDRIEYIFTNENKGFGAGHNIAIMKSIELSRYYLVLNPDIYFVNGTLEKIYNFMENKVEVGLVMPKVLSPNGSTQYLCKLLPTAYGLFLRRFFFVFHLFSHYKDKYNKLHELRFTGYDKIMEVPYLSGCFMFIRNEVFKKIGGFDERYFMYLEDVDLSRRIYKYYKNIYYPEAVIYHGNERGSYKNLTLLKYHIKSSIKYFNKWGWFYDKERDLINNKTLNNLVRGFNSESQSLSG